MERTLLFKDHLSVNILAKYQLIIGIHMHPHQYLACYIFSEPSACIIAHGVGVTPMHLVTASSSHKPWYKYNTIAGGYIFFLIWRFSLRERK